MKNVFDYEGQQHPMSECVILHEMSDYGGEYIHRDNAVAFRLDGETQYFTPEEAVYDIYDTPVMLSDAVFLDRGNHSAEWCAVNEAVLTEDAGWVHVSDTYYVSLSDGNTYFYMWNLRNVTEGTVAEGWYSEDDCVYVVDADAYYHVDDEGVWYTFDEQNSEYVLIQNDNQNPNVMSTMSTPTRGINTGIRVEDYHQGRMGTPVREWKAGEAKFTIGFEVEKEDTTPTDVWSVNDTRVYGWVRERDGSLNHMTGYELVSPTYDLFGSELDTDLASECITEHVNAAYSESCGGHINFGIKGLTGLQVYEQMKGFTPLLLSLYKGRLLNRYCKIRPDYKDGSKMGAVHVKPGFIEYRVPSAVKSTENLLWRRDLLRIAAEHAGKGAAYFTRAAMTKSHPLHKHLRKVYDERTIALRVGFALSLAERMEGKKFSNYVTFTEVTDIIDVHAADVERHLQQAAHL